MKIYVTDMDGTEHALDAIEGWRVMEIIKDHGLPIKAECGGCCACGTCHVYVDEDWIDKLYPMRDDEEEMLDLAFGVEDRSRLSCQIIMSEELDGLKLTLAPGSEL
jgi:2Fe-2S ferredoxin